jgi:hypothetical protein
MASAGDIIRAGDFTTDWTTFTPTFTNFTVGNGTVAGKWRRIADKMIFLRAQFTMGSTSAVTGNLGLTIPGGLSGEGATLRQHLPIWGFDSSASGGFTGSAVLQSGGGTALDRFFGPTTSVGWTTATPITWATGDIVLIQGYLEVTT